MVKVREDRSVRNRACYLAIGVSVEGEREVLGIWWQETEGAKFWLAVLNDLQQRGVEDVLVCCVDGLNGFPEAIEAVFPKAWVQSCIVHQIRSSMRFVAYTERKRVAADLKPIYRAVNVEAAEEALQDFDEKWGEKYPMIAQSWRARWENIARSSRSPPTSEKPSTRRTASRTSTGKSERRSRPEDTSPTSKPPPSSSTSPSNEPRASGNKHSTGQQHYEASRSTSETDYPTNNPPGHTQKLGHPHSRRIVGWSMAEHMKTELVTDALNMAVHRRRPDPRPQSLRPRLSICLARVRSGSTRRRDRDLDGIQGGRV